MLEKIPGKIWNGGLSPHIIRTQKQRGQKSETVRAPSVLAEIWIRGFINPKAWTLSRSHIRCSSQTQFCERSLPFLVCRRFPHIHEARHSMSYLALARIFTGLVNFDDCFANV